MQAYNCYVEAIRLQPNFAIAWSNLAGLFMEANDLNRALQYYKVSSLDLFPYAWCVCLWCRHICFCAQSHACVFEGVMADVCEYITSRHNAI